MKPDSRAIAAPGEQGQFFNTRLNGAGQEQHGARHGQADLGADAESDMLGRCPQDANSSRTWLDSHRGQAIPEAYDEPLGPIRERTFELPTVRRLGHELDRRVLDHQAEAAELSAQSGPPSQQAEMEPARCPDAHASIHHGGAGLKSGSRPRRAAASRRNS